MTATSAAQLDLIRHELPRLQRAYEQLASDYAPLGARVAFYVPSTVSPLAAEVKRLTEEPADHCALGSIVPPLDRIDEVRKTRRQVPYGAPVQCTLLMAQGSDFSVRREQVDRFQALAGETSRALAETTIIECEIPDGEFKGVEEPWITTVFAIAATATSGSAVYAERLVDVTIDGVLATVKLDTHGAGDVTTKSAFPEGLHLTDFEGFFQRARAAARSAGWYYITIKDIARGSAAALSVLLRYFEEVAKGPNAWFEVDADKCTVTVEGEVHDVTPDQAIMVNAIAAARGGLVTDDQVRLAIGSPNARPDRLRDRLHTSVVARIKTKKGAGGGSRLIAPKEPDWLRLTH